MNQYINLITFLLPIIFSPGPNNIMMASMGKSTVNKKNIPFIIGVELILIFYVLLACTGGSNIVEFVKSNNSILSLFGAGYFLYL